MTEKYPLSDYDWEQITATFPPDIAILAHKYPCEIYNLLDAWDDDPLPEGYIPQYVDVYTDEDESVFSVLDGDLVRYVPSARENAPSIQVEIDGRWVYMEIEGRVILDKLGGVVFPDVDVTEQSLLKLLAEQI